MSTNSSFTTGDHVRIAYELHGDSTAKDRVVLIHSLAMDHAYWRPVADRLVKAGACTVALDCRGHGASGKPEGPYHASRFGEDIGELMDHLKWPKAFIGGSSMGGSVALAFAARHAARVAGLTLIDTTAWYGEDAPKAWAERASAAKSRGLASLIEFQLTRWFGDDFKVKFPEISDACVATFLKNDIDAYAATCNMLGTFDERDSLGKLKMPVRIMVGEEDYATPPAMAQAMHKAIQHSTFLLLPKARHLTPLERPDEVASEIIATIKAAHG